MMDREPVSAQVSARAVFRPPKLTVLDRLSIEAPGHDPPNDRGRFSVQIGRNHLLHDDQKQKLTEYADQLAAIGTVARAYEAASDVILRQAQTAESETVEYLLIDDDEPDPPPEEGIEHVEDTQSRVARKRLSLLKCRLRLISYR